MQPLETLFHAAAAAVRRRRAIDFATRREPTASANVFYGILLRTHKIIV
jgi:hypothetical protein